MKPLPVSETILQPHAVFDEVDPYMSLTEGRDGMSPLTSSLSPENDEHLDTNNSSLNTTSPNTIPPPPVRKSTRTRQTPHWLQQYQTFQASSSLNTSTSIPRVSNLAFTTTQPQFQCLLSTLNSTNDFKDAVTDSGWVEAMNAELTALEANHT